MNHPPAASITDIVGLAVAMVATIFSPAVADIVGPYVVIAAASVIGASFGLARRPPSTRLGAFGYFLRQVGLSILLTVGLAAWLVARYPDFSTERALLAPLGLLISFADWETLLPGIVKSIRALILKGADSTRNPPGGAS